MIPSYGLAYLIIELLGLDIADIDNAFIHLTWGII